MNEEKSYELRELQSADIFLLSKIISKIGVKNFKKAFSNDEIREARTKVQEGDNEKLIEEVGLTVMVEIVDIIVNNLPDCENELYQFLANVSGLKKEKIQKLGIATFMNMIVDVIKKPEFLDFFKAASRLFK